MGLAEGTSHYSLEGTSSIGSNDSIYAPPVALHSYVSPLIDIPPRHSSANQSQQYMNLDSSSISQAALSPTPSPAGIAAGTGATGVTGGAVSSRAGASSTPLPTTMLHSLPDFSRPASSYQDSNPGGGGQYQSSQFGIPSVKPIVNDHDRMWAEVEILQETEAIARQAEQNGSFFGTDHAQALNDLRQAQSELVKAMAQGDKRMGQEQYQNLWE